METEGLIDAATIAPKIDQAKSSVYRLAKLGLIPSYKAGPRQRGVRFKLSEVLQALKRTPSEVSK